MTGKTEVDVNYFNDNEIVKRVSKMISEELTQHGRFSLWEVFDDVIDVMAIAISNQYAYFDKKKEEKYFKHLDRYGADWMTNASNVLADILMFFSQGSRTDLLGRIFHSLEMHNKYRGQFFTPYEISLMIAKMTIPDIGSIIGRQGYATMNEPACGSGGMIIAYAQAFEELGFNLQTQTAVVGQDLDSRAVKMAYIQCSCCGIPAIIIQGNTLSNEVNEQWFTPAYIQYGWHERLNGKSGRKRSIV